MSISTRDATATDVSFGDRDLRVALRDGRTIIVPLSWFPRLAGATPAELASWRFIGAGAGIHWDALDEDLSVEALLRTR